MDPVLTAIDDALRRTGLTDAAASKLAVGNYSLIKNMRADRGIEKRYSFQALQDLARVLGLECYFGPKRELAGFSDGATEGDLGKIEALRAGYLPIPWHDRAGRKGSAPVALQSSWLASEGIAPDHLKAVVPDELQLAVANAGQTVAVLDTIATQKGSNGLWCYAFDGKTIIGQVAFADDVIVTFPTDQAEGKVRIVHRDKPKGLAILGRAVWLGLLPKQ